jgi:[acyl-carrier-protein] S-malonyltransferase
VVGLLFPGQGAQYVGMGRDLAERYPAAREIFERAAAALETPLSRIMWEGREEELTATHNAQPAILVHSAAVHALVLDALPDVELAAGHSLGEFSAYLAAGVLSFEDAVRAVRRRGELMYSAGQERPGTMAAILGLDDDAIEAVCRDASAAGGDCVPANFNSPGQVVISGDVATVERALELAKDAGARRALPLSVSGAFHSPLMGAAEMGLRDHLETVTLSAAAFPVVSNVTAGPVTDPEEARRLLVAQLTSPVRWTASVRTMLDAGVTRFLELGPGSVLAGLARRIEKGVEVTSVGTVAEAESFLGD